jgi:hypothetical protein
MYYCLIKSCGSNIKLLEADKDEKRLLNKLDKICKDKLKEKGIQELEILQKEPNNINYPTTYIVSNRNFSNRTEIHHYYVKDVVVKGWIYNSKKYDIIHEVEIYDVLPIDSINIIDENTLLKKYIYDVNDYTPEKKRKIYDGESLFLN